MPWVAESLVVLMVMVPPVATWKLSTSRCQKLNGRSVQLMSLVIKCFYAACLDPHCRWMKCTTCNRAVTITGLTPFDASCLFGYINGRVSTIGRKRRSETYIDLGETNECASTLKTIHRVYTLTKCT